MGADCPLTEKMLPKKKIRMKQYKFGAISPERYAHELGMTVQEIHESRNMSKKLTIEGLPEWETEDSGAALIGTLDDEENTGCFVRLQSWDEDNIPAVHDTFFGKHRGKRFRVTIEVID